jgi:phosphonate transport system substrate-binding protein
MKNLDRSRRLLPVLLALGLALLSACSPQPAPYVRLSEGNQSAPTVAPGTSHKLPLRLAVAAVISPRATLDAYGPLLDYLSARLDRPVQLIQRGTYAEINDLIRSGDADLAFVCGGAYVEGEREFGMQLLVAPQVRGELVYYSYIIVASDSPAQSLADLRGRAFAFTDPLSNSGHLAPQWMLYQIGETPETFFDRTTFTYSHDNSIRAVADHIVDGAAVDSLVYDYTIAREPSFSARTRVIAKSPPYGVPPVVVHPDIDPALRSALRDVLLTMRDDPQGQAVLRGLMIDQFVEINPAAYDDIRQMAAVLRGWNGRR